MQQFQNSDLNSLVDALAEYSEKYYTLLSGGGSDTDLAHCRITIHHILREINSQKNPRQLDTSKHDRAKK